MKNLILILFAFLSVQYAYAQKVIIKNKASVTLPKNSIRLQESSAEIKSITKRSQVLSSMLSNGIDIFVIGGFPIALNPVVGKAPSNHLERRKLAFDYDSKRDIERRHSVIKEYDGFKALIVCIEWKNQPNGIISITCLDSSNTKALGGHMEYPKALRDKAGETLDKLLRTWKFH